MANLQKIYGTANFDAWSPYPQPFYDAVVYPPAGTSQIEFFAVPRGNPDPNGGTQPKTLEDTNLLVQRQLGQNYLLTMEYRAGIFLATKDRQPTDIATDASLIFGSMSAAMPKLYELFNRGTIVLYIDSKVYATIDRPFIYTPAGMGLNLSQFGAQAAAGPAVQSTQWIQNNPDTANVFSLGDQAKMWVGPIQTISAILTWPDGPSPVLTGLVDGASPVVKIFFELGGYMFKASQ